MYIKSFLCVFILMFFSVAKAQNNYTDSSNLNAVEISLLTCEPHDEVYSLYGHTAIRVQNKTTGSDVVINYGMFSFAKPFFILRFVFGLTDYEMGIEPFDAFAQQYLYYGSNVVQQTLNLTNDDKQQIIDAISNNYKSENVVYRYNYFYDNCTTRARDIIINNVDGRVVFNKNNYEKTTYRKIIHQCTTNNLWARFGNDLLLGMNADKTISFEQMQFLPNNLKIDFDSAKIVLNNKQQRKLVSSSSIAVVANGTKSVNEGWLTPRILFVFLFVVTIIISAVQLLKNITMWIYDLVLLLSTGLCGVILFAMIFSQHPTVQINFQILILNPVSLFMIYKCIKSEFNKKQCRYWNILAIFVVVFLLLNILQDYAEGMNFLALSLLLRSLTNIYVFKINNKSNLAHCK